MKTVIIPKWHIELTISRTLEFSVEDFETKDDLRQWLKTPDGRKSLVQAFIKGMNYSMLPSDCELTIDDIRQYEYEVKSTDTDPRV